MNKNIYLGIDIEKISRINKLIEENSLVMDRLYTKNESTLTKSQIASNFAVKEAAIKALSSFTILKFSEIEILRMKNGAPSLKIFNKKIPKNLAFEVSISHVDDLVLAVVVAQIQ
jgi:phosphopantetheine--protein transferase-like protein